MNRAIFNMVDFDGTVPPSLPAWTNCVTFIPSALLAHNTTYTARISGAKDAAGNVMASFSWSLTTAPAPYTTFNVGKLRTV